MNSGIKFFCAGRCIDIDFSADELCINNLSTIDVNYTLNGGADRPKGRNNRFNNYLSPILSCCSDDFMSGGKKHKEKTFLKRCLSFLNLRKLGLFQKNNKKTLSVNKESAIHNIDEISQSRINIYEPEKSVEIKFNKNVTLEHFNREFEFKKRLEDLNEKIIFFESQLLNAQYSGEQYENYIKMLENSIKNLFSLHYNFYDEFKYFTDYTVTKLNTYYESLYKMQSDVEFKFLLLNSKHQNLMESLKQTYSGLKSPIELGLNWASSEKSCGHIKPESGNVKSEVHKYVDECLVHFKAEFMNEINKMLSKYSEKSAEKLSANSSLKKYKIHDETLDSEILFKNKLQILNSNSQLPQIRALNQTISKNEHDSVEILSNNNLWYNAVLLKFNNLEKTIIDKLKKYSEKDDKAYFEFNEKIMGIDKKLENYKDDYLNKIQKFNMDSKVISDTKSEQNKLKSQLKEIKENCISLNSVLHAKVNNMQIKIDKGESGLWSYIRELRDSINTLLSKNVSANSMLEDTKKIIDKNSSELNLRISEKADKDRVEFVVDALIKYKTIFDEFVEILNSEKAKICQNTNLLHKLCNIDLIRLANRGTENSKKIELVHVKMEELKNNLENYSTKEQSNENLMKIKEELLSKMNEKIGQMNILSNSLKMHIDKSIDNNKFEMEIKNLKSQTTALANCKSEVFKMINCTSDCISKSINNLKDHFTKINFKLWKISNDLYCNLSKSKCKCTKCHECDSKINALNADIYLLKKNFGNVYRNYPDSVSTPNLLKDKQPNARYYHYSLILRIKKSTFYENPHNIAYKIVEKIENWPFKLDYGNYFKLYNLKKEWIYENMEYLIRNDLIYEITERRKTLEEIPLYFLFQKRFLKQNFRLGQEGRKPKFRYPPSH